MADPRAGLAQHLMRAVLGPREELPEARIDFLGENVASMAETDVLCLNSSFERVPAMIGAGDVSWVKRPRRY